MQMDVKARQDPPEYQAPATLNQAAPVTDTWYVILDTTENGVIYQVSVNVEDANEDLEVRITIDGEVLTHSGWTANHSTTYYIYLFADAINRSDRLYHSTDFRLILYHAPLGGHSVKVEVRKTTATGAGNLMGIVEYGVYK